jgi:cytoskeleton protein RodZ
VPAAAEPVALPASAASAEPVAPTASAVPTVPAVAVAEAVASVASAPPAPDSNVGLLQLRTTAASWIEVIDAQGKVLLSRVLAPDESLTLDGAAPLKLKIGNAAGTRLVFRGEPVDLASFTRNNVARLELK